jgi:hypothetical protein
MVVLAGAGLDAASKQAAQDALHSAVRISASAREALTRFVGRRIIRGKSEGTVLAAVNTKELSRLLLPGDPLRVAVDSLVRDLEVASKGV